jgi:serine/threonine protein kinase
MGDSSPNPRSPGLRDSAPGAAYKKGDVIGQKYEVYGVLGAGGFGIVYLVYSRETKDIYALKTFRDEFLADAQTRERFRKEAQVWVDLERHPYLVRAHLVDEVAGRLFVVMEHVAPDESGLNSFESR